MRELLHSITRNDFRLDWYSGTGAGGQHRNKHQNCLRMTHLESGITVQATEHKDRPSNQKLALKRMAEQLRPWIQRKIFGEKPDDGTSDEIVRTYHHVDNRVKDHASGHIQQWGDVLKDPSEMIEARLHEVMCRDDHLE